VKRVKLRAGIPTTRLSVEVGTQRRQLVVGRYEVGAVETGEVVVDEAQNLILGECPL